VSFTPPVVPSPVVAAPVDAPLVELLDVEGSVVLLLLASVVEVDVELELEEPSPDELSDDPSSPQPHTANPITSAYRCIGRR
jgi:hypothetical protein